MIQTKFTKEQIEQFEYISSRENYYQENNINAFHGHAADCPVMKHFNVECNCGRENYLRWKKLEVLDDTD